MNDTCKKCIHLQSDLSEAKKLLTICHNDNVRLRAQKPVEQYDLDTNLKALTTEDCLPEHKVWRYVGIALVLGFFIGFMVSFRGFN